MADDLYAYFNSKFTEAMDLKNGIDYWKKETHKMFDKKTKEIFNKLKKTTPESRSYDSNMLLARLAVMKNDKKLAYEILVSIRENGTNDPCWNSLMADCLSDGLPQQKEEALKCCKKIITLSEENKIPQKWQFLVFVAQIYIIDLEKELGGQELHTIYEEFTVHTD